MFLTLFNKEVRQHIMTFRFAAALITTMLLVILSFWVLGDDYLRRRNAYNLAAENSAIDNLNVFVPSQISPVLHRPPSALSVFAQGEDRRFGNSSQVRRWEVPRRAESSFTDNMLMAAEPALDMFTIISIVLSLFGLLFTYESVSGERERGTLKMMCTGQVSRAVIFGAKFFAGIVCLAIPFLLSFISGLLILTVFFSLSFSGAQWLNIVLMLLVGLLFGALFIAVGLASSALVKKSSIALVFSLLIWVVTVLLIPSTAQSTGRLLKPIVSTSEVSVLEKASMQEAVEKFELFKEKYPRYWSGIWTSGFSIPGSGSYLKYDGGDKHFNDAEEFTRFVEDLMIGRAERIWNTCQKLETEKKQQASLINWLSLPSPSHHLRNAFTSLAGTDYEGYAGFLDSVRRYRRQMINDFENRGYFGSNALEFFTRRPRSEISDEQYAERRNYYRQQMNLGRQSAEYMGPSFWGVLPPEKILPYEPAVNRMDLTTILSSILFIVLTTIIAFAIGFIAFVRYDVR